MLGMQVTEYTSLITNPLALCKEMHVVMYSVLSLDWHVYEVHSRDPVRCVHQREVLHEVTCY